MTEKLHNFTDPAARTHDGVDRIRWVQFDGGVAFRRRSGKFVGLFAYYRKADANSSTLAGILEMDAVGITGGHPESTSSGDKLPVNFAEDKTCVIPTSNRVATELDVGKSYDIVLGSDGTQFINMSATARRVLTVHQVIDDDGKWVSAHIAAGMRYGNI